MCLIFIALNYHPRYKLIVAANRDEFYQRKTQPANFWEESPDVLAGRDLEAHGTWMGVTRTGRISFLTNYRDPANINPNAPSRGKLVSDYLMSSISAYNYLKEQEPHAKEYNGFNLITGTSNELFYLSNYKSGIDHLTKGFFGLSNHLLDTPWPKVIRGKKLLEPELQSTQVSSERLLNLLQDENRAQDHLLPDTGIGMERERALSSMFIKTNNYGSRCSTVVLIDHQNHLEFTERVYDLKTFDYSTNRFTFSSLKGLQILFSL